MLGFTSAHMGLCGLRMPFRVQCHRIFPAMQSGAEERGERREETEKREREPKPSRKTDIAMLNPKRHKFLQDAQNP